MSEHAAAVVALVYEGVSIGERGDMLCMTDMWRAAGADPSKRPAKWRETAGADGFIAYIAGTIRIADNECFQVLREGAEVSTYAHWQVGMAYAQYLSHPFHAWCNRVVRDYMEARGRGGLPRTLEQHFAGMMDAVSKVATGTAELQTDVRAVKTHLHVVHTEVEQQGQRLSRVEARLETATKQKRRIGRRVRRDHGTVLAACLGGLCQACRETVIVDEQGNPLPAAHADHAKDVDCATFPTTWLICECCNRRLGAGTLDRGEYEAEFAAYRVRAKRFFQENPHRSCGAAVPRKPKHSGPTHDKDPRQPSLLLPL